MYENILADRLKLLTLLMAFGSLVNLLGLILYDMNKRTSQGHPAGNYSADKQWRYYLAKVGSALRFEADSAATYS